MKKFAEKLKALRLSNNLTQKQLAEQVHVTKQSVSKWEHGRSLPDIITIEILADFFNTTVDSLINNEVQDNNILTCNSNSKVQDNNNFPCNSNSKVQDNNNFPCNSNFKVQDNSNFPCNSNLKVQDNSNFPCNSNLKVQDNNSNLISDGNSEASTKIVKQNKLLKILTFCMSAVIILLFVNIGLVTRDNYLLKNPTRITVQDTEIKVLKYDNNQSTANISFNFYNKSSETKTYIASSFNIAANSAGADIYIVNFNSLNITIKSQNSRTFTINLSTNYNKTFKEYNIITIQILYLGEKIGIIKIT